MNSVNPDELRTTLRSWASGVTVVSSRDQDQQHGMTVSAFASLSLEPPLVLVSLERSTRTHALVSASGIYAVSVLAADQAEISDLFAGRVADDGDRFEEVDARAAPSGAPVIEGSLGFLDCEVVAVHEAGTHTVFIGEVRSAAVLREAPPLLYFNQQYRRLDDQKP